MTSSTPTAPGTPEQHPTASSATTQEDYPGLQDFKPQWLLLESNEWRKRVQVTQRFVDAVRVVIYRNRAKKRLQKLKILGGGVMNPASQAGGSTGAPRLVNLQSGLVRLARRSFNQSCQWQQRLLQVTSCVTNS